MQNQKSKHLPPVVAVLGHVDHGKTTLLDAIRKTDIAAKEHGGITQKIGASEIEVDHEGEKRKITFIDTPGHEAFFKMRGRGVAAADLVLLVISSVDGVMPQTIESIKLIKDSNLPFIVVLTKSDDPKKQVEKTKQQLVKEQVMLEGLGGDVPVIEVSARNGTNIKELLDLIILVFDIKFEANFYPFSETGDFMGIVIESKLDKKSGPMATVVVKNGQLKVKDEVYYGQSKGKVRNLLSAGGKRVDGISVGEAAEVLGFEKVPPVGSEVSKTPKAVELSYNQETTQLPESPFDEKTHYLNVVLVADNLGSMEAITNALPKEVKFISQKTGEIDISDVLFAKSSGAIVLGFNVRTKPEVVNLASTEKVIVRNYNVIYEMINEISDFIQGKIESLQEQIYGIAKILASFPFEKTKVMGVKVSEGRIAKGDKIRLLREDDVIGETKINSVRKGKESISKIETGEEGGLIASPFLDFTIGDMLISHS